MKWAGVIESPGTEGVLRTKMRMAELGFSVSKGHFLPGFSATPAYHPAKRGKRSGRGEQKAIFCAKSEKSC